MKTNLFYAEEGRRTPRSELLALLAKQQGNQGNGNQGISLLATMVMAMVKR